ELDYLNKTDYKYNTSWHCKNSTDLEYEDPKAPEQEEKAELFNICNNLSQKVNQVKEETVKKKAKTDGINNIKKKEIVYFKELKDLNMIMKIEKLKRMNKTNFSSSESPEYDDKQTWESRLKKTEKDEQKKVSTNYQISDETIFVSKIELGIFDLKKEEKVENLYMEPEKIIDSKAIESASLDIALLEHTITKVLDTYYSPDEPIGEPLDNIMFIKMNHTDNIIDQQDYQTGIGTEKDTEIKNNHLIIFLKLAKTGCSDQSESQGYWYQTDSRNKRGNRKDESKALAYEQELATIEKMLDIKPYENIGGVLK
ncbi:44514_t:CDS:2, partial [Gigaspora margarita]